MSDGQRTSDIINIIITTHSDRNIKFFSGLGAGLNVYRGSQKPPILVFDHTLQDLGGEPTNYALYYEVDGVKIFIDETLVDPPTTPPTSQTIYNFRVIHNIKVEEQ